MYTYINTYIYIYTFIKVGQTAFVLGSHKLRISAHIMNEEGGQEMLENRLVRPHLKAGDALIFDCRILHFGLANQHSDNNKNNDDNNDKDENDNNGKDNNDNHDKDDDNNDDYNDNQENDNKIYSNTDKYHSNYKNNDTNNDRINDNYIGTGNTDGWRPLLYVNYHQKFFQDPKNWNDKERLFQ
jgi:hypothetical protein